MNWIYTYTRYTWKKGENNNNTHEQPSFMCVFMSPISPAGGSMVQGGELTAGARSQVGSLCFNRSDTTYFFKTLIRSFE